MEFAEWPSIVSAGTGSAFLTCKLPPPLCVNHTVSNLAGFCN